MKNWQQMHKVLPWESLVELFHELDFTAVNKNCSIILTDMAESQQEFSSGFYYALFERKY